MARTHEPERDNQLVAARLAPDAATLAAAQRIAVKSLWPILGRSERALWGEHLGTERYQVAVDLLGNVGRCTCPSRKVPCKHAVALMLMAADGLPLTTASDEPDEVAAWLARRAAAVGKTRGPVKDLEAQAERKEQREARVAAGVERLDRFMEDVVRQGLGSLDGPAGQAALDTEARRLVDAQAPGLAGRLRAVASRLAAGGDWAGAALARLGRLALLSEAYTRLPALPPALGHDVRALVGFPVSDEDVRRHGDVVTDQWFVIADVIELDGALRIGRTWLRGRESGRDALVLRFAPVGAPFNALAHWLPGHDLAATLAFYPSAHPERAALIEVTSPDPRLATSMPGALDVAGLQARWAAALADQPFLERVPAVLAPVEVTASRVFDGGGALPLVVADAAELLALAGGAPVALSGLFDGARFQALGVFADGRFGALTPGEPPLAEPASRLSELAVVGTAKKTKRLDDLPAHPTRTPERRLLLAAGVEAVRRAAATLAEPRPTPLPPAPPEPRPPVPPRLAQLVAPFLSEPHALVDEALPALSARGLRLPFELLAPALPRLVARAADAPELLALLGERGRWLGALGVLPSWTRAFSQAPPEDPERAFLEGDVEARARALARLLTTDRPAARALLTSTWRDDKPEHRARWLELVDVAVGPDDAAWLEPIAASDRSLGVRRLARRLLGRVPGSSVHARHAARVAALTPLALPADSKAVEADFADDGLTLDPSLPLGPRARLLAALVAHAPLDLWAQDASAFLRDLVASEHAHAWLVGGALAGARDPAWAGSIAAAVTAVSWPRELAPALVAAAGPLFSAIPDAARADRIAARWYRRLGEPPPGPWGPELSRAALAEIEAMRLLPPRLPIAACLHPSLLAMALDLEPIRRTPRVAAALDLRRRLHAELAQLPSPAPLTDAPAAR